MEFFSSGLALASLLPVQDDIIYQRFDAIIQCICETLNDIMKEEVDNESSTLVEYVLYNNFGKLFLFFSFR